jgi:muramoyltetrapeptide carboxypeptidase
VTFKSTIPMPLREGDIVGIAAVSGPVTAADLEKGIEVLQGLELRVRLSLNIHKWKDYLAGPDHDRVEELNKFLVDPAVRGIFFARGGYGSMRILPEINYKAILTDPKIMIGMSDLTALSMAVFQRCGVVTLAGPMIAGQVSSGLDEISMISFVEALTEPLARYQIVREISSSGLKVLRRGKAKGPLLGGCLSLLVSLLGTPYCPDFTGCVLFIEDVNEPPYRIDRMLTQMKLAGIFENIGGVIICQFSGDDPETVISTVERIVLNYVKPDIIPVISNFPHGHVLPNMTLPVGVLVEFEASIDGAILRLL